LKFLSSASASAQSSFAKEVKDLTVEDLLVSSDLSDSSSEEDQLSSEPELVADQPTVEAAKGNWINPEAWTPISTGPPQPVPPEHRVDRSVIPKKKKAPSRRSARIRVTAPKAPKTTKAKEPPKKKGSVTLLCL
jgi:hypothetical protein